MKNIAFTIVAKNYLPLARALAWSLTHNNNTNIEFVIFLADEPDGLLDINSFDENIIPVSRFKLSYLKEWAFKYNVTEFCTAIKPYCFKYIFNEMNAENVIYFDPDVYVFNSISPIIENLKQNDVIITPHYLTPQINYTGDQEETRTLFVGIYNFGFVAFKNTNYNLFLLDLWENRLSKYSYADWQDALHTDQKWADFFPVFARNLLISKSIGYNVAPWNLFEREIYQSNNCFYVRNRFNGKSELLIFVHFAGYDPKNLSIVHKNIKNLSIEKYPEYNLVRDYYKKITDQFSFEKLANIPYSYSVYSNGMYIQEFHRRFFRVLLENGISITDPFNSGSYFYKLLQKKKIIGKQKPFKLVIRNYPKFENERKKMNIIFTLLLKIIGVDKYFLLMKFLNRYSRPENQLFLLGKDFKKFY